MAIIETQIVTLYQGIDEENQQVKALAKLKESEFYKRLQKRLEDAVKE